MTRAVTTQFAAATLPSLPALDADLLGLANLIVVACTATGTNAVVLTPVAATVTVSAYSDKELYSFNAPATSTGVMTVQVSSGAALKLFKPGGTIQATTGDVTSAQFYIIAYQTALDTGAGGFIILNATNRQPTRSVLTSGTSYTTPVGATRLDIRMVGGGGGGAGSGTTPGAAGAGGNTTFGVLTANGGAAGSTTTSAAGGAATGGDINLTGAVGQAASTATNVPGGNGGASPFGGAGAGGVVGNTAGLGASGNTGSGGGGAADAGNANTGGGGAAGGYIEKRITSPAATYAYTIGAAGTAGTAGGGGVGGGVGGSGLIIVDEYYN